MSDAYDRIWAGVITDEFRGMVGTKIRVWGDDPRVGTDDPAIEYIRIDHYQFLESENRRLRKELNQFIRVG